MACASSTTPWAIINVFLQNTKIKVLQGFEIKKLRAKQLLQSTTQLALVASDNHAMFAGD
jgi:hypothetical protein